MGELGSCEPHGYWQGDDHVSLRSTLWCLLTLPRRRLNGTANVPDTTPPTVPVVKPKFLESRFGHPHLRATWLGHACYYLEFPSGLRVLLDPVFEDRCSPFSFMGPKRYTPPPCQIKDIPVIDVVVISHSHYDHLSHPSITEISKRHPNVLFAVPLGLKKWFNESGVTNVVELDWWQDVTVTFTPQNSGKAVSTPSHPSPESAAPASPKTTDDQTITATFSCLPSQHTSARTAWDTAQTLWASWSIKSSPPLRRQHQIHLLRRRHRVPHRA